MEAAYLAVYSGDPLDKVKRKRVLISSDFRTALKYKNIFDVYFELIMFELKFPVEESTFESFELVFAPVLNRSQK